MELEYDEKSPVTGNMSVLVEDIDTDIFKLCMESGYYTMKNAWTVGSSIIEDLEKTMPSYISESKIVDENSNVWYLMSTLEEKAALLASKSDGQVVWSVFHVSTPSEAPTDWTPRLFTLPRKFADGSIKEVIYELSEVPLASYKSLDFELAWDHFQQLIVRSDEEE